MISSRSAPVVLGLVPGTSPTPDPRVTLEDHRFAALCPNAANGGRLQ